VIFWDTSALVPLLVDEGESARARTLAQKDPEILVWWGSSVECASALSRLEREGRLLVADVDAAWQVLTALRRSWNEVLASEELRDWAERLVRRHPLRAADALQLGAALVWARGRPTGHAFASLDERLQAAARREGFAMALSLTV
jgi:predicted nucleic acid-binding protein